MEGIDHRHQKRRGRPATQEEETAEEGKEEQSIWDASGNLTAGMRAKDLIRRMNEILSDSMLNKILKLQSHHQFLLQFCPNSCCYWGQEINKI